jgi:hypothetical protein
MADASLAAHNRRYRDDVVRIGRVAHAEKKAKCNNGKQSDHLFSTRGSGAKAYVPAFANSANSNQFP